MGADPSRLMDGLLGGTLTVVGLSLFFVSLSGVGAAFWFAPRMRPSGLLAVAARAALGSLSALVLTVGAWMASMGLEATTGFPLGPSSGGGAWVAWYLGAKVLGLDAVTTAALLGRLRERTGSALHSAAAAAGLAWALGAWGLAKVCGLSLFVVVLGLILS